MGRRVPAFLERGWNSSLTDIRAVRAAFCLCPRGCQPRRYERNRRGTCVQDTGPSHTEACFVVGTVRASNRKPEPSARKEDAIEGRAPYGESVLLFSERTDLILLRIHRLPPIPTEYKDVRKHCAIELFTGVIGGNYRAIHNSDIAIQPQV